MSLAKTLAAAAIVLSLPALVSGEITTRNTVTYDAGTGVVTFTRGGVTLDYTT